MLADAINLPLVALYGLAVFGPLTLLVTMIECLVFKLLLRLRCRAVFKRVLVANVVSTLAGGVVLSFQDRLIHSSGIIASIPAFVHGYWSVGLVLVSIYYAKSAIVESLIVPTRRFAARVERSRLSLVKGVVIGNVASYLVVGPLFVLATRPTFGHLEVTSDTGWTANPDQVVYFIGAEDHFIKRVNVSGSGLTTLVPYPAAAFLVSADETAFAYRGTDGNLYAYRVGDAAPVLIWATQQRFLMHAVSLSPDKLSVVYAEGHDPGNEGYRTEYRLSIFEMASRQASPVPGFVLTGFGSPIISWSHDGSLMYAQQDSRSVYVISNMATHGVQPISPTAVRADELVGNYVRSSPGTYWGYDDWGCLLDDDSKAGTTVRCWLGLGAHLTVERDEQPLLRVSNDYGLLKLGLPGPSSPTFLAKGSEILVEWWGQIYLLDFERRRMGLLVSGRHYILPTPRFQVRFE
ncbi:MAG: hypothetical protein GX547_05780 [Phycisphaerae bacterium]|nr:hypothetical protein [Phycisphaerae bacterium]